jgi:ubiquinone/menaquinone biosynthesis C-methylase UbiE
VASDPRTYYRDHWVDVEPERLEAYEAMFQWRDTLEPLIAPARIGPGLRVVDYGCGPGHMSVELARRVGPTGQVFAVDINPEFLERTRARAEREGFGDRVEALQTDGERLPLADGAADRVLCKNVLEYVPDPEGTAREFFRVLAPGGLAHATDSDWGLFTLEPIGPERTASLMAAASVAFRTPLIGRRLFGILRGAGFDDVRAQVLVNADTQGFILPVVRNMISYARASGRSDPAELAKLEADIAAAIEAGTWLALLPQFLVTGAKS